MNKLFTSIGSLSAWIVQPVVVALILVVGFVSASRLSLKREEPERSKTAVYAPLVRTIAAERTTHPVEVHGNGSLQARTRIALVPQVGGKVLEIHPGLRDGGRFRAGEMLVRLEALDSEIAITRVQAEIDSAQSSVATTLAESESAIAEWEQARPGEEVPPLVQLEPQLLNAKARVQTLEAQLAQARLNLSRTKVSLPFDGRVVSASVDVGEVVMPNQGIAVVYATDVFEVAVPLRTEELIWLALPDGTPDSVGSAAVVHGMGPGGEFEIAGHIARMYGELDATSRLAHVVVEINANELDPQLAGQLVPGTFVDVTLEGSTLENVVDLPRSAIRESGQVWVVEEGLLRFVKPKIVYQGNGTVLVKGIEPNTLIVVSNLDVVTDGMQVRIQEADAQ
ncbi:MAG: RND family efflux transporter MFP subunit [Hyphomicrobiaceae bacterium]|jgi:RND family efflux transporter MFP subunit